MRRGWPAHLQGSFGSWIWILFPVFLAAIPHFSVLPLWIGAGCTGLWTLRLCALSRPKLMPSRWLRYVLTLGCIAGVYASYGYLLGPEPGTALLLLLLGLKPLEARSRRDQLLIVFMAYLLVLLQFLNSQSLLMAGYMILVVLMITASLLGITHSPSQTRPEFRIRAAGILLAQAVPVMLILFVLFPRLPGSLWGMWQRPETGVTGLSETMRPGDISELLQSSEVVFRVSFDGSPPAVARMYWRALVLWDMDGRTWRAGRAEQEQNTWRIQPLEEPVAYDLTLEAHRQRWLPVLEMPTQVPPNAESAPDFRLQTLEKLEQRARYSLLSALDFRTPEPSPDQRRRALALPETGNSRARALALSWAEEGQSQEAIVGQALDYFRTGSFVYTLRPGLLGEEAVDDFLFRTRSGYCEHFASAFTFLMRAAGIPARVIVGYQGGDRNPLGEYYVIRQYHAHAWSEIWLNNTGWKRVDPTAVLAPERIDLGAEALIPNIDVPRMLSSREVDWMISTWRALTQGWDATNALWNQWVLDFGFERQRDFLKRIGLAGATRLERFGYLALAVSLSLIAAALVYALVLKRSRVPRNAADRLYARFCAGLNRIGITRAAQEGPRDFARRASALRPDLAAEIMAVSDAYIHLRYGPDLAQHQAHRELARMVRRFRPKRL